VPTYRFSSDHNALFLLLVITSSEYVDGVFERPNSIPSRFVDKTRFFGKGLAVVVAQGDLYV
jgi:hypothetical protein